MEELLKSIAYMDEEELMEVIKETARAWGVIKPGTELVYIFLPLDDIGERKQTLQRTMECLLPQ